MSIIQSIRDKAAWIIIGAIALALIAFIVQDAFQNRNLFGGNSTTIGVVNGVKIDLLDFEEKYKRAEELYRQRGFPINDMMRTNIRESLWNEYVDDAIMKERYERLGIQVSDKELSDILYGENPPDDLRNQFTDPNTKQYDANAAYQAIQQLKRNRNKPENAAQYASFFGQYLPALAKNRQKEKYLSLLGMSVYVPKWLVEKMNTDNSQSSSISYVNVPYSTVSDSAVQVTDAAINDYVKKHPDEYEQEESRSIEYVMFDAGPTKEDSAAILSQVEALKTDFATTNDVASFMIRNGSETPYTEAFEVKSKLRSQHADSISQLAEGQVAGPFIENGNYVLVRMMEKRNLPDSVKVRHILVKTGEQGTQTLADSTAKARIDSISNAIRGGANFADMVVKYSDDQGSKETGGEYEFALESFPNLSREFAEVAFYGVAGDKKTVKVENQSYSGYHYIEVINQRKFEPAYKFAEYAKAIVPSEETIQRQNGIASQFAAESRTKKQFDDNAKKNNYNRLVATEIKPLDAVINGIGTSREVVKWAYGAKPGEISETPFQVDYKFVVPVVTKVYEKGLMTADKARPMVESILRNEEKGKQIIAKIGKVSTLEEVAQKTSQQVAKADSLMFSTPFIPNVGQEPKVIGAAFDKSLQGKVSQPIAGNGGVFVIKVENQSAVPTAAGDPGQIQAQQIAGYRRAYSDPRIVNEVLKKSVKIKDERYKFF
ncbi:MAG: SurA N-terminal domain-containing protein [Chitinophagaceae bacterium]|nr:SurA N-terminal domain-containing protein [Chitinophagaceae bacterium]